MNPRRVDYIIDLVYGVLILVAIVFIIVVEASIGVAFGVGVLLSYLVHVAWKMARFDPEWMTREVTENIEQTISEEIDEVTERLEEVNERVDRRPVADEIEQTGGGLSDSNDDSHREQ